MVCMSNSSFGVFVVELVASVTMYIMNINKGAFFS